MKRESSFIAGYCLSDWRYPGTSRPGIQERTGAIQL